MIITMIIPYGDMVSLWPLWVSFLGCILSHFLVHPLLSGQYKKQKSPRLSVNTAKQQLQQQCINIIFLLNPATMKKINSIQVESKAHDFCLH